MSKTINEDRSPTFFGAHYNVACPFHQGNCFTNICISEGCAEPLCPECVAIHIDSHNELRTAAKIESLANKRKETEKDMNELINQFHNEKKKLLKHSDQHRNEIAQHYYNKISRAKNKIIQIVESYFDTLLNDVKKNIEDHAQKHPGEFKNLNLRVDNIIMALEKQMQNLRSQNYIKSILKFQGAAVNQDYQNLKKQVDEAIELYISDIKKVVVDESKFYCINVELSKLIYLKDSKENELVPNSHPGLDDKYSLIEKAFAHDLTNEMHNYSRFTNIHETSPQKLYSNVSNYNFSESKIREHGKGNRDDLWREKLNQNYSFYFPKSVQKY